VYTLLRFKKSSIVDRRHSEKSLAKDNAYNEEEDVLIDLEPAMNDDNYLSSEFKDLAYSFVSGSQNIVSLFDALGEDEKEELVNDRFQLYSPDDAVRYLRLAEFVLTDDSDVGMDFGPRSRFKRACKMIGNDPDSVYESLRIGVPLEDILA